MLQWFSNEADQRFFFSLHEQFIWWKLGDGNRDFLVEKALFLGLHGPGDWGKFALSKDKELVEALETWAARDLWARNSAGNKVHYENMKVDRPLFSKKKSHGTRLQTVFPSDSWRVLLPKFSGPLARQKIPFLLSFSSENPLISHCAVKYEATVGLYGYSNLNGKYCTVKVAYRESDIMENRL